MLLLDCLQLPTEYYDVLFLIALDCLQKCSACCLACWHLQSKILIVGDIKRSENPWLKMSTDSFVRRRLLLVFFCMQSSLQLRCSCSFPSSIEETDRLMQEQIVLLHAVSIVLEYSILTRCTSQQRIAMVDISSVYRRHFFVVARLINFQIE